MINKVFRFIASIQVFIQHIREIVELSLKVERNRIPRMKINLMNKKQINKSSL